MRSGRSLRTTHGWLSKSSQGKALVGVASGGRRLGIAGPAGHPVGGSRARKRILDFVVAFGRRCGRVPDLPGNSYLDGNRDRRDPRDLTRTPIRPGAVGRVVDQTDGLITDGIIQVVDGDIVLAVSARLLDLTPGVQQGGSPSTGAAPDHRPDRSGRRPNMENRPVNDSIKTIMGGCIRGRPLTLVYRPLGLPGILAVGPRPWPYGPCWTNPPGYFTNTSFSAALFPFRSPAGGVP